MCLTQGHGEVWRLLLLGFIGATEWVANALHVGWGLKGTEDFHVLPKKR